MKAKEIRQAAWQKIGQQNKWGILIAISIVYSLLIGALSATGIGSLLLVGPITLGFTIVTMSVVRAQETSFNTLFSGFNDFVKPMLLHIIMSIFIALWSLLFVIPGIIKRYSYSMSYYILADNPNLSANEARKESMRLMNGNKWRLFCLDFSYIGWWLLSLLTFGILSFFVTPYQEIAHAEFYESIRPKAQPVEAPAEIPAETETH